MTEVMLIRWPEDAADGIRLARAGAAVLYLVGPDDDPPTPTTCLEDWMRTPGDDRDLSARVAALEARAASHNLPPRVDDEGRLHFKGQLLTLAPLDACLAHALATRFDQVVPDDDLVAVLDELTDPGVAPTALRTQVAQLRAQLRPLDLVIRRVPRRGYRLHRR